MNVCMAWTWMKPYVRLNKHTFNAIKGWCHYHFVITNSKQIPVMPKEKNGPTGEYRFHGNSIPKVLKWLG